MSSIDWYGEVWDLLLDGTALVRFPDGTKRPFHLSRLIHLDDGLDPEAQALAAAGLLGPDGEELGEEGSEGWMTDDDGMGEEDSDSAEQDQGESDRKQEEEVEERRIEDGEERSAKKRKRSRRESRGWADEDEVVNMEGVEQGGGDEPVETRDLVEVPSTTETPTEKEGEKGVSMPSAELDDFQDWSRFEVLEEVPIDHHYSNEVVQVPSKSFMSRVRKEHGVLASSLPRMFQLLSNLLFD